MTLVKFHNKNGYCRQPEAPAYGLNDLLSEFPFRNFYTHDSFYGSPRVNIKEEQASFQIEMDAPGIDKSLLKMNVEKNTLTVSYNKESEQEEKYTHREFNNRNFERSFHLPESVNKDKISAVYIDGILKIELPKREESIDKGPRNIEIS